MRYKLLTIQFDEGEIRKVVIDYNLQDIDIVGLFLPQDYQSDWIRNAGQFLKNKVKIKVLDNNYIDKDIVLLTDLSSDLLVLKPGTYNIPYFISDRWDKTNNVIEIVLFKNTSIHRVTEFLNLRINNVIGVDYVKLINMYRNDIIITGERNF